MEITCEKVSVAPNSLFLYYRPVSLEPRGRPQPIKKLKTINFKNSGGNLKKRNELGKTFEKRYSRLKKNSEKLYSKFVVILGNLFWPLGGLSATLKIPFPFPRMLISKNFNFPSAPE